MSLKLKPICYHYGEKESTDHLWGLDKLRANNMTNGHKCFSLHENFHDNGKAPNKTGGKHDHTQVKNECQVILYETEG